MHLVDFFEAVCRAMLTPHLRGAAFLAPLDVVLQLFHPFGIPPLKSDYMLLSA